MVANTIALIRDTRVPAVLSTVITVLYFVFKLFGWLADSFHAIPDKTKGQQIMPTADRNKGAQGATKGSQSREESKSRDTKHQTFPNR